MDSGQVSTGLDSSKNQMLLQSSTAATKAADVNNTFDDRSARADGTVTNFSHYVKKTSNSKMMTSSHSHLVSTKLQANAHPPQQKKPLSVRSVSSQK